MITPKRSLACVMLVIATLLSRPSRLLAQSSSMNDGELLIDDNRTTESPPIVDLPRDEAKPFPESESALFRYNFSDDRHSEASETIIMGRVEPCLRESHCLAEDINAEDTALVSEFLERADTSSSGALFRRNATCWPGIVCNTAGRITEINLPRSNLTGPLPESWSLFGDLEKLVLQFNHLTGTVPESWGALTKLETLDLCGNSLTGSLPYGLSSCTDLRELNLSSNSNLQGTLPTSWSTLTGLRALDVSYNDLSGTIPPEYRQMADLEKMRVGYNKAQMICTPELMEIITPSRDGRPSLLKDALQAGDEFFFKCFEALGTDIGDHQSNGPLLLVSAATAALAVILLTIAAFVLVVVRHRSVCDRDDCPHRHPGFLHSTAAALGVRACSGGCPRCNWDDAEPDMNVSFDEIAHCLVPKAFVARGACGIVYRGTWRGRDVAIKHVTLEVADDSIYDTFLKELEAGKRFGKCDRMLQLLGACLERPNVCLIHEFVQGGTLRTWINNLEKKPFNVPEILLVVKDLASGLATMHPDFVHRDLKPDNILMGSDGRPKIIDFGLGRLQATPLATEMSTGVGTPAYMAPEMFNGKISAKVDIYALGIILNECLTRMRPFSDYENPSHIIFAVGFRGERPRLPCAADGVPEAVLDLVTRCWDSDPRRRPAATEIEKALDRILGLSPEPSFSVEITDAVSMSSSSAGTWSSMMGGRLDGKRKSQGEPWTAAASSAEQDGIPNFESFDYFRSMERLRYSGGSEASFNRRASGGSSLALQSLPSAELQRHHQDTAHHAAINIDSSSQDHQP